MPDSLGTFEVNIGGSTDTIQFAANPGQSRTASFQYEITDDFGATDTATVTVDVEAPDAIVFNSIEAGNYNSPVRRKDADFVAADGNAGGSQNDSYFLFDVSGLSETPSEAFLRFNVRFNDESSDGIVSFFQFSGSFADLRLPTWNAALRDDLAGENDTAAYAEYEFGGAFIGEVVVPLGDTILDDVAMTEDGLFAIGVSIADDTDTDANIRLVAEASLEFFLV